MVVEEFWTTDLRSKEKDVCPFALLLRLLGHLQTERSPPFAIEPTIDFVFPDRTVVSLPLESNKFHLYRMLLKY